MRTGSDQMLTLFPHYTALPITSCGLFFAQYFVAILSKERPTSRADVCQHEAWDDGKWLCIQPEEGDCGGLWEHVATVSPSVAPLWATTLSGSARDRHTAYPSAWNRQHWRPFGRLWYGCTCWGKTCCQNMLPLLIYSCGPWAAVWNCGPVDEKPGSWNIHIKVPGRTSGGKPWKGNPEKMDPV